MQIVKKMLLWWVGTIAAFAALVVSLQVVYKLTPSALSPETVRLNERAALLPTVTENGYRAYGLLAPKDADPAAYGRCLIDANDAHRAERQALAATMPASNDKAAYDAYWKKYADRDTAALVRCLNGGARVQLPKALADLRIKLGIEPEQWRLLSAVEPDPLIVARAEAVWAGGPRRLGVAIDAPIPPMQALLQLEHWRTARAMQTWQSGERMQAVAAWNRSINDWVKSADDSLISAMISTVSLSQIVIAMQDAMARSERVDDATAAAALAALASIELMPKAVANTMLVEWQMTSELVRSMPQLPSRLFSAGDDAPGLFSRLLDQVGPLTFDVNDTLNYTARGKRQAELSVMAAAQGEPLPTQAAPETLTQFCGALGEWEYACLPLLRNPTGRILALIAVPSYTVYGVRIADLRNLAAATRLTIEARRRAVSGDALANVVTNAPAGLRDVFTQKPFAYDPVAKQLKIELRTKSNVLGDNGVYSLKL